MKKRYLLYTLICLFIPTVVFAATTTSEEIAPIFIFSFLIGLFQNIMIVIPLLKLKNYFYKDNYSFISYFVVVLVNILGSFIFNEAMLAFSFMSIFLIGFPVIIITNINSFKAIDPTNVDQSKVIAGSGAPIVMKCLKCNNILKLTDKFCEQCGENVQGNNVKVEERSKDDTPVDFKNFSLIYKKDEETLIKEIINDEMKNMGLDVKSKLIPSSERLRFIILDIIFCILLFIYIGLIFYHIYYVVYPIGLIVLLIFFFKKNKFDLSKYLYKEVKSRPDEDIDNIIGAVKENLVPKFTLVPRIILPILVVIVSLIIFRNPIIFYEKIEGGYAMRFYFTGWTSLTKASIPEKYKGENVISLRGNAFSNMPLLKEVYLPDTITEIRGEAFKNDFSLKKVHLPANLNYLGGESFYNCYSLIDVNLTHEMPLTEIKGSTFENCSSLKTIVIPDTVTRIGGHAFHSDSNLEYVDISELSDLIEIGSSAFRDCTNLKQIILPPNTSINSNTFKGNRTIISRYGEVKTLYDNDSFVMKKGDSANYRIQNIGDVYINYYDYYKKGKDATIIVSTDKIDTITVIDERKKVLNYTTGEYLLFKMNSDHSVTVSYHIN